MSHLLFVASGSGWVTSNLKRLVDEISPPDIFISKHMRAKYTVNSFCQHMGRCQIISKQTFMQLKFPHQCFRCSGRTVKSCVHARWFEGEGGGVYRLVITSQVFSKFSQQTNTVVSSQAIKTGASLTDVWRVPLHYQHRRVT